MTPIIRRWLIPVSLLGWLGMVGPASAVFPPPVKDEARFFKPETLEKAAKKIRDIYREFYKDVVVETFPAIPADLEKKYKEEGRSRFFADWAERRLDELGVNGVYILIVRDPRHLRVTENRQTRVKQFTRNPDRRPRLRAVDPESKHRQVT